MRGDMGKVVLERPRRGHAERGVKAKRFGQIVDGEYYGITRIPMSISGKQMAYSLHREGKSFSDLLGPLNKYLRSNVGRKWDDVYSEIKQILGNGGWPMRHIVEQHINVHTNTYRDEHGQVWAHSNYRYGGGPTKVWNEDLYVEPGTGILRIVPGSRWANFRKRWVIDDKPRPVDLSDGRHAVKLNGLWYLGKYVVSEIERVAIISPHRFKQYLELTPKVQFPDYVLNGKVYRFTQKKQANKKEIRLISDAIKR